MDTLNKCVQILSFLCVQISYWMRIGRAENSAKLNMKLVRGNGDEKCGQ